MKDFLNRPVKIGLFLKLIICLNVVFLAFCMRIAYIGDLKDEEMQQYYNYLENRITIQSELIQAQQMLLNEYTNN